MKIVFYELEGWERADIEKAFRKNKDIEIVLKEIPLNDDNNPELDADVISVFIYSKISSEVIDQFKNLKLIATRSTGYDHIDVEHARKKGIYVCNVPNYGDVTVAEYTVALILSLLRRLKQTFDRVEKGIFSREGLRGTDLQGKTVGVIGTGKIGSKVVKILSSFDVKILAMDIVKKEELIEKFKVNYVSLEELLKKSDIVTLHVPYSKSTHHLINRKNIRLMKKGAYLINTSRGPVLETEALIEAIKEGRLAGVALDTFEGEEVWIEEELIIARPDISATLLKKALESFHLLHWENAILTPHNAYNTKEAIHRILTTTIENIKTFIEKGYCINSV